MLDKVSIISNFGEVPHTNCSAILKRDGTIIQDGVKLTLKELNEKFDLKCPSLEALMIIVFHPLKLSPIYWEKLRVHKTVEDSILPETLIPYFDGRVESVTHPGFFIIPKFSDYLMDDEGRVIRISEQRYMKPSKNNENYFTLRLRADTGNTSNQLRHRIMMYMDSQYPSNVMDLDINHKNGVRGDDFFDNLEWVTRSGNINHAYELGLRTDNKAVEAKSLATGEVSLFYSRSHCARQFDVTDGAIANRCQTAGTREFAGWVFRDKPETDIPWPPLEAGMKSWKAIFDTGKEIQISANTAASMAGLTRTSFQRAFRTCKGEFKRNGIKFIRNNQKSI